MDNLVIDNIVNTLIKISKESDEYKNISID